VDQTQSILPCLQHDGVTISVFLKKHLEYKSPCMSKNVCLNMVIYGGWMHKKVAHFLCHDAHFHKVPFLWTLIMNNKINKIEKLKLIIHEQLDYENTYVIIFQ